MKISTKELKTGMVLGKAVLDKAGRALLPEGTELSEKHLKIFVMWGISEVEIQGGDDDTSVNNMTEENQEEEEAYEPKTEIEIETYKRFKHASIRVPFNKELYQICLKRAGFKPAPEGEENAADS